MFCKNCGKENKEGQKFCTNCGVAYSTEKDAGKLPDHRATKNTRKFNSGIIIKIIIGIMVVGWIVNASLDEKAATKNNEALSSFNSGDSKTAITQLEQAMQEAAGNGAKLNTLKNLGYVHSSEGENGQALSAFREALTFSEKNSFDFYLISGEIAMLEYKPNAALLSFNKAYELNPKDFQINNSLALFYLDVDEISPQYADYAKALSYAKKAYEYDTGKSEFLKQNLAIAHLFNENFDQTISLLSTSNLSQHPYAAYWIGLAYLKKEDFLNAKLYLRKALDGNVKMPQEIIDYANS